MTGQGALRLREMFGVAMAGLPREGLAVLEDELRLMLHRRPPGTDAAAMLELAQAVLAEARAPRH